MFLSAGASLAHEGTIAAPRGTGVIMTDASPSVVNLGRIAGGTNGVLMGLIDRDNQQLTNTGSSISGARPEFGLRFGHGVHVERDTIAIFNAGDIRANATGKAGIHSSGQDSAQVASGVRSTNDSEISSSRGWGVDGRDNLAAGFTLVNNGIISGGSGGIRGMAGVDVVTNTGRVQGSITPGAGADRYQGGSADIAQSVFGEVGTDSLEGGVFDDLHYGGTGVAYLLGGTGDDDDCGGRGVAYDAAAHTIPGSTDTSFAAEFRIVLQVGATVVGSDFIF